MYMFQEIFEKASAKPTLEVSSLVKNNWYMIDLMGMNVRAKLMESPKQGKGYKSVVMMDVRGSDVGMFDEMGSVYVTDIVSEYAE
jgi:hypothetical protein